MRKRTQFKPGQMVEPVQSCSIDVPTDDKDAEGNRVFMTYTFNSKSKPMRAEHPAVQAAPNLFQAVDPMENVSSE